MIKFWDKVDKCKHKNMSPDYYEGVYCDTPYCGGWEEHCLDCGVYITRCGCMSNSGMSGWPYRRWRASRRKKYGNKLC